jgi:Na+/H+ antiporter NhaD/arsenite permease-like protein
MNALVALIPVKARKWLYSATATVNSIALVVLPLLVSLNIVPSSIADQIVQIIGAVLAIFTGYVAFQHAPVSQAD